MGRCYEPGISPAYREPHTHRQRGAALTGAVTSSRAARTAIHRTPIRRGRVVGLLVVMVAVAALGDQVLATSSSTSPAPGRVAGAEHGPPRSEHPDLPERRGAPDEPAQAAGGTAAGALGEADGAVPDGTTVFEDDVPAVANLDPALLAALRQAATAAAADGVELVVDSGWRSSAYQAQLLREAVARYGSEHEAARWVATPDTSAHVSGDAVDIGPSAAAAWLSEHGAVYGLCQIYGNEPWHYEPRPAAVAHGCPPMYADPTQDPRLRR
jgi:hypothetical protein